jgi:hypothetical protein
MSEAAEQLIQHSSATNEHYTPKWLADAVTYVLGRVHLDPASSEIANDVVGADCYYSLEAGCDGLARAKAAGWHGNVFLNPPGGRDKEAGAAAWWRCLVRQWSCGNVEAAIFLAFNMNVFRTSQQPEKGFPGPFSDVAPPYAFPFCVPASRIAFDKVVDGKRVSSSSPPQDSAIVLLPPRQRDIINYAAVGCEKRFAEAFGAFGHVRM